MKLTENAVKNPASVAVVIAIVSIFGFLSLVDLPIQLFPDIERPTMTISTFWRSASPNEMESEILKPQEEVLQGLPGLKAFNANAGQGSVFINLEFGLDTDMQAMMMEVIGRLNRLPPLPPEVSAPQIFLGGGPFGGGSNQSLIWFFVQQLPGTPGKITDYRQYAEDVIKPKLSNIEGVAGVNIHAGADNEMHITIDPYRAAELGINLTSVASLAGRANDVSGGFVDVGRRQYTLRFAGRYNPEQLQNLILEWRDGSPVRLGDIAEIRVGPGKQNGMTVQNGNPAMGVQVLRENGANVLETLTRVKQAAAELRDGPLKAQGLGFEQSFDASVFIQRAISLVTNNLLIGIFLALGVLWWFMRDIRATFLIATAIPICLLTTFVVLEITGRTLNVISLAGLAFAVGMVLDAAIVVSENIVRLKEKGSVPRDAALAGTRQVGGALLASTATTVAIFIPVLFIQDVEGQLFADLALTIAIAVSISLIVALTILPSVAGNWLKAKKLTQEHAPAYRKISGFLMKVSDTTGRRLLVIASLLTLPVAITWMLFPQLDYLPPVKRDAVDAFLNMPAGTNFKTIEEEVVPKLVERLKPYMDGTEEPALKNYYIIIWPGGGTLGVRVKDQSQVKMLETVMREKVLAGLPDVRAFAAQGNLFGNFGGNRSVVLHMLSSDSEGLNDAAAQGLGLVSEVMPDANVQTWPNVQQAEPEIRLIPDDQRINESGWDRRQVGALTQILGNGMYLGEYFNGENRLDIIMRADGWETPEELASMPVVTPSGAILPMGELVSVERTTGPSQIRRFDGRRAVSLVISPPDGMSLETAVNTIREQVEPKLREALPGDASIQYGGSADSLNTAVATMSKNFLMALLILFVLMAGLFRSIKDSALVVLTIPLATVGGIVAIRVLNLVTFQPMDLLTMIGFIILLGLVVNNAILLVHHTRQAEAEGETRDDAVAHALHIRMRPIFMSTFTTIFGMLPLLLIPGEGSVIYRGLAAAIVGGMLFSLIFTLVLLPSLLRFKFRQPIPAGGKTEEQRKLESVA